MRTFARAITGCGVNQKLIAEFGQCQKGTAVHNEIRRSLPSIHHDSELLGLTVQA
jgi:hypothetical protein